MALLEVNFRSVALGRNVTMQVILPADKLAANGSYAVQKPFRTLYLLHGLHGNHADWNANTRIRRWAQDQGLAVVMPAGDNAFYVDQPLSGNNYGIFVGQELVEITRAMFPLSHKREDTFIGGLSMGGFGALRNGLKYHNTFGAIISLSGATDILHASIFENQRAFGEALFGPIEKARGTDKDPRFLIAQLAASESKPRIYMACGSEDYLLPQNRSCRRFLEEAGFDLTYVEGPGNHNWDFWDTYIKKALDWLL